MWKWKEDIFGDEEIGGEDDDADGYGVGEDAELPFGAMVVGSGAESHAGGMITEHGISVRWRRRGRRKNRRSNGTGLHYRVPVHYPFSLLLRCQ